MDLSERRSVWSDKQCESLRIRKIHNDWNGIVENEIVFLMVFRNIGIECSELRNSNFHTNIEIEKGNKKIARTMTHRRTMRPAAATSFYMIFLALLSSSTFVWSIEFGLISPIGKCLNSPMCEMNEIKNLVKELDEVVRIRAKINKFGGYECSVSSIRSPSFHIGLWCACVCVVCALDEFSFVEIQISSSALSTFERKIFVAREMRTENFLLFYAINKRTVGAGISLAAMK